MGYFIGDRVIIKSNNYMDTHGTVIIKSSNIIYNRYLVRTTNRISHFSTQIWLDSSEIKLDKAYYREEKLKLLEI